VFTLAAPPDGRRRRWRTAAFATIVALVTAAFAVGTAQAQMPLTFKSQVRPTPPPAANTGDPQMLLRANEIQYDYPNERVSAVGNVQVYYKG